LRETDLRGDEHEQAAFRPQIVVRSLLRGFSLRAVVVYTRDGVPAGISPELVQVAAKSLRLRRVRSTAEKVTGAPGRRR
jgi:hypothetical protein